MRRLICIFKGCTFDLVDLSVLVLIYTAPYHQNSLWMLQSWVMTRMFLRTVGTRKLLSWSSLANRHRAPLIILLYRKVHQHFVRPVGSSLAVNLSLMEFELILAYLWKLEKSICLFVLHIYVFVLFCSSGCQGLTAVCDCGIPWTFL